MVVEGMLLSTMRNTWVATKEVGLSNGRREWRARGLGKASFMKEVWSQVLTLTFTKGVVLSPFSYIKKKHFKQ